MFLDRDGTIIEGEGYLGDADRVVPISGVREALETAAAKGWRRIVVTNQSGVARGYFSEDDYRAVEAAVAREFPALEASYACFHLPEGVVSPWNRACGCRKPLPGMLEQAAREHGIALPRSVLVGDDVRDLLAARAAGVEPVLVRTGKGVRSEQRLCEAGLDGIRVIDDLRELVASLPLADPPDGRETATQ